MKAKSKPNFFLRAALALLCLVLISAHFTSGLYARFTTRANGTDQSRIAAFAVTAALGRGETDRDYTIQVLNRGGETAVSYSLEIALAEGVTVEQIPSIALEGEEKAFSEEGKLLLPDLGILAPGADSIPLSLRVNLEQELYEDAQAGLSFRNDDISHAEGDCPFTVRVICSQVD